MALVKSLLKGLAALVALIALFVVGVFAWNVWKVHLRSIAAQQAATEVCASLPPGSAIAPALEHAAAGNGVVVELPAAAGYEFQFMYFLSGWACRAEVANGKVTRVAIVAVN